jgi:L-iditol 2-dehydrogenase
LTSLPESGRAALIEEYGAPLAVREYPVVEPQPGSILVRVDRATICGSDVHTWTGKLAQVHDIELPIVPGHEVVGEIVAFGPGEQVDSVGASLRAGDRVIWTHEACGHCYYCTVERNGTLCENRRLGFLQPARKAPHFHGTFAEYSYVWPRSGRLRVPDDVESGWASAASCALRTVLNGWKRLGAVGIRDTVVIQGAGPLGLFATAVAAVGQPRKLVVVGGPESRLEIARRWGADLTISVDEVGDAEERRQLVLEATDGRGADVVAEFSGAPGAFAEGIGLAALNGRYLVVGTVAGPPQEILPQMVTRKNLSILGSLSADVDSYYDALVFLRRFRATFDWDAMLGRTYSLDDLTEGMEAMRDYTEVKAVLDPALG